MEKSIVSIPNLDQLFDTLWEVEKSTHRHPVVFISVRDPVSWDKLIKRLQEETSFIRLSSFCAAPDTMPLISINHLREKISQSDTHLTLLPLGEWLHLGISEPDQLIRDLATLENPAPPNPASPKLFVPLLQAEELLLRALRDLSRWHQGECAKLIRIEESSKSTEVTIIPPVNAPIPRDWTKTVSYTHLTLPTNREV